MIAGDIPGRTQTAAVAVFDAVESGNTRDALWMVLAISAITISLVFLSNRLERRRPA
jgi:molybdate transport system permease protein